MGNISSCTSVKSKETAISVLITKSLIFSFLCQRLEKDVAFLMRRKPNWAQTGPTPGGRYQER